MLLRSQSTLHGSINISHNKCEVKIPLRVNRTMFFFKKVFVIALKYLLCVYTVYYQINHGNVELKTTLLQKRI